MRVNELSKQIGKSNKEVLEILQKNHFDVKSHSSKVTEEQAEAVRCFLKKIVVRTPSPSCVENFWMLNM